MLAEIETVEREAIALAAKRKVLEARRPDLFDKIAAAKARKPPVPSVDSSLYRATAQVQDILDVSCAAKTTIQIGDFVAGMRTNTTRAKASGRRVVFVNDSQLKRLVETNAIALAT